MLIQIISPTPVLNTANFSIAFGGKTGHEIPLNEKGLAHYYEFVALKGAVFKVEETFETTHVYRVSCPFYPKKDLYIDRRFTKPTTVFRTPQMPNAQLILERMKNMKGTAYIWGGNWSVGIPEMLQLYPPNKAIDPKSHILWTLKGVDCSGLLYEATDGASPRNTHQLVHYGNPVAHLSQLKPLDMIVYPGHVLFVFTQDSILESVFPYGVIERPLQEKLSELLKTRQLTDCWTPDFSSEKFFTLRRFI